MKVRGAKDQVRLPNEAVPSSSNGHTEEKTSKGSKSGSSRLRRGRVAPDGQKMADVSEGRDSTDVPRVSRKRRSSKTKAALKVDTSSNVDTSENGTPRTAASTPSTVTPSVRSTSDIRSPGQRKSPLPVAAANAPVPDFITQTDKDGNATTPRSETAVSNARRAHPTGAKPNLHVGKNGKLTEESDVKASMDVCTETFIDSIRLMCCCLVPDDDGPKEAKTELAVEDEPDVAEEAINVIKLLPEIHQEDQGKKCLVLDLDETLVHSSFRAVAGADFVIPVQIEDVVHFVYVMKRPGVDEFLVEMAKHYEVIIYTASLNKYADPLLDLLDPHRTIRGRLFRESCVYYEGNYVKDLSLLDRDLSQAIIVDNSPNSYIFHPENAIDCSSFIDDPKDRELDQIGAFLTGVKDVKDVRGVCHQWREWPNVNVEEQ